MRGEIYSAVVLVFSLPAFQWCAEIPVEVAEVHCIQKEKQGRILYQEKLNSVHYINCAHQANLLIFVELFS